MLVSRRASGHPTEDHHDSAIFLWEFVVLDVLGGADIGRVLWLVLPTEACLTEPS
jgi:hypothetical protein